MRFFPENIWSLTIVTASILFASINVNIANAGGDPNVKDKKVDKKKSNIKQHDHSKVYKNSSKSLQKNKNVNEVPKNQNNDNNNVETAGFAAVEDEPLIVDLSSVVDSDGMGSVGVQWQISSNGKSWTNISRATSQSFTPREIHVGKKLRVVISYVDGQGNLETLVSPPSTSVKNVNDKPTGAARLIGASIEDSALVVDTSSISDEDGIGGFEISWQR